MNPSDLNGGGEYRTTVDFTLCKPQEIEVANCVSARTDRGISNRCKEGSCVYELSRSKKDSGYS